MTRRAVQIAGLTEGKFQRRRLEERIESSGGELTKGRLLFWREAVISNRTGPETIPCWRDSVLGVVRRKDIEGLGAIRVFQFQGVATQAALRLHKLTPAVEDFWILWRGQILR